MVITNADLDSDFKRPLQSKLFVEHVVIEKGILEICSSMNTVIL